MSYFKELYDKPLQRPENDIAVIDRNQIYQQSVQLILGRAKHSFSKYNLKVKGTNGIKYYKGKSKERGTKHIIYTLENSPIFNIQEFSYGKLRKNIYLGKNKGKLISRIKCRHSNRKYRIEITNLITGDVEYLEMNSDKRLVVCGIFYGNEEKGAPLIAKITRDCRIPTKCTLDIAPGVDNIFMMGLAAFFSDRIQYKSRRRMGFIKPNPYNSDDSESESSVSSYDGDIDDSNDYNDYGYGDYNDCDSPEFDEGYSIE